MVPCGSALLRSTPQCIIHVSPSPSPPTRVKWIIRFEDIHEASPMGGSFWEDNNDGTFTNHHVFPRPTGYGSLDLYVMGLMRPEEVPDFFLLENISPTFVDGQWAVSADKKVISIDQVIAAMGPRLPPASDTQKNFSTAFILVVPNGTQPRAEDLDKVEEIGVRWEEHFRRAAGGRATMSSTLITAPAPRRFMPPRSRMGRK